MLIRGGKEVRLKEDQHNWIAVHLEMLLQVVRDYAGIGDWRKLTSDEIEFFYNGLREEIKRGTKPTNA